jgi:hypothetical protein
MVGHVHRVHRRGIGEVLVTGDAARVVRRHQFEPLSRRASAVSAIRQRDEHIDLLRVHRGRRGARLQAVNAATGPQQRRRQRQRQRARGEFAR